MQRGKVSEITLNRSILKKIKSKNEHVSCGSGLSSDASEINLEGITAVMSSNIIETWFTGCIEFYFVKTLNNIYVKGGKPYAVEMAIVFPANSKEQELGKLMREIDAVAEKYNLQLCGGQTTVSQNIEKPIITFTIVGKKCYNISNVKDIKCGMQIVMTKSIAVGGIGIVSQLKRKELEARFINSYVEKCNHIIDHISVEKEARIACKDEKNILHDISTGGTFAGLWELASPSNYGVEVFLDKIPVWQETVEVAEVFDINPYVLDGTGSLLIVTENSEELIEDLVRNDIDAAVIGTITKSRERVLINGDEKRFLEPQRGDEIYKFI